MGNRRKGQLTADGERHKHLRPYSKRKFWKGERKAGKEQIKEEKVSSITPYKYNYRPGYGSDHLLIQISMDFDEREKFISDIEGTLDNMKAKVKFIEDRIPVNDDLVYSTSLT